MSYKLSLTIILAHSTYQDTGHNFTLLMAIAEVSEPVYWTDSLNHMTKTYATLSVVIVNIN